MLLLILRPSTIDIGGIGVFASVNIPAETPLPLFAKRDCRFVSAAAMRKLPPRIRRYVKMHSVKTAGGYDTAIDWHRMSVGWYLNHSDTPNVAHRGFRYYALRNIKKGEELATNYDTFATKGEYGIK